MAFYKKQKMNGKWYPRSFTVGTMDTDQVAERLSQISTVSKGDTYAVLLGLGEVLGGMLEAGYSVKLKGVGTFYLTGRAEGQGVDTPEEVSGQQFSKLQVRFIPEYRRMQLKTICANLCNLWCLLACSAKQFTSLRQSPCRCRQ